MNADVASFDQLVASALEAPFTGWDFSWLTSRATSTPLPWSYTREVAKRAATATAMLDLGTGGGEQLSRITPRPARTVATEAWLTNVGVAAAALAPLGIPVVHYECPPDNADQAAAVTGKDRLPFSDGAFDLVINRHEAFQAEEIRRVLAPGGTFITQQVDNRSDDDLYRMLGLTPPAMAESWLALARSQLTGAGLTITMAKTGEEVHHLHDISAVVYYLRVVSWEIPEYSVEKFRPQLRAAFDTKSLWPLPLRQPRFLVVATR